MICDNDVFLLLQEFYPLNCVVFYLRRNVSQYETKRLSFKVKTNVLILISRSARIVYSVYVCPRMQYFLISLARFLQHFYKIELPEDKEYHINKLLGEIRRSNPVTLPFFEEEPSPKQGRKGKKKQDEVAFTPYYGPSTSKGPSTSGWVLPRENIYYLLGRTFPF